MRAEIVAATVFTALLIAAPSPGRAADLYGEGYQPPYDEGGYAERRYSERDYDEDVPPEERYDERYPGPDRPGSIKDGYPVPVAPPHYGYRGQDRYACADKWEVRRHLRNDGWVDFRVFDASGPVVALRARRIDTGRVFLLRVEKCSGEVVNAEPFYLRSFGAYAPRPWERPWHRPHYSRYY
jgi:hypothetical protein